MWVEILCLVFASQERGVLSSPSSTHHLRATTSFSGRSLTTAAASAANLLSQHLPKGLVNQTNEEAEYLGYHKCMDAFEAYGASYLITAEHLLLQNTNYSLDWVNCEMASFIMVSFLRLTSPWFCS
jgi:hypothetical protein